MVDFWFNHFNVFAGKDLDHLWIGDYGGMRSVLSPWAGSATCSLPRRSILRCSSTSTIL